MMTMTSRLTYLVCCRKEELTHQKYQSVCLNGAGSAFPGYSSCGLQTTLVGATGDFRAMLTLGGYLVGRPVMTRSTVREVGPGSR